MQYRVEQTMTHAYLQHTSWPTVVARTCVMRLPDCEVKLFTFQPYCLPGTIVIQRALNNLLKTKYTDITRNKMHHSCYENNNKVTYHCDWEKLNVSTYSVSNSLTGQQNKFILFNILCQLDSAVKRKEQIAEVELLRDVICEQNYSLNEFLG